jgi:hypothetical protein
VREREELVQFGFNEIGHNRVFTYEHRNVDGVSWFLRRNAEELRNGFRAAFNHQELAKAKGFFPEAIFWIAFPLVTLGGRWMICHPKRGQLQARHSMLRFQLQEVEPPECIAGDQSAIVDERTRIGYDIARERGDDYSRFEIPQLKHLVAASENCISTIRTY